MSASVNPGNDHGDDHGTTVCSVVAGGGPDDFMTVRHLVVRGTQRDVGRELAREALAHFPTIDPPDDPALNRARRRWVERNWPEHYARMQGIADARGVDLLDDHVSLVEVVAMPFRPACSVVWCPPAVSRDGHGRCALFSCRVGQRLRRWWCDPEPAFGGDRWSHLNRAFWDHPWADALASRSPTRSRP
jgi:hypothetical protein